MPPTSGAGATGGEEPSAAARTGFMDLLSPPVRERCRIRRFAPGDVVVHEGEAGGSAFILVSGHCEVTVHGETLNLIHPGELFGEIACLEAGTRTATVRAAVESDGSGARGGRAPIRAPAIARDAREVPSGDCAPRSRHFPPRDHDAGRAARAAEIAREPAAPPRPLQGSPGAHGRSPLAANELCIGRLLRRSGAVARPPPVRPR